MVLFADIVARVSTLEDLYPRPQQAQLLAFFDIGTRFAPFITLTDTTTVSSRSTALPELPENIAVVLCVYTRLPLDDITALWAALGDIVLRSRPGELVLRPGETDDVLAAYGPAHHLGAEIMLSHATLCATAGCPRKGRSIAGKRHEYGARLFTRRRGVLPIRVVTLYCKGCNTTYRPNYTVRQAQASDATRVYPLGIPNILEVAEHTYLDKDLLVLFRAQMAFAHASGDVVAKVYNLGLSSEQPAASLTGEMVWNAFYLHALLADAERRSQPLELPHHGSQDARFNQVLRQRNDRMKGLGQPHWAHACDECEHILPPPEGTDGPWTRLSACVMDGVTLGHPQCNERGCQETLRSPRDRFCAMHGHLTNECAMDGCSAKAERGFWTCTNEVHREYERKKREQGQAIYRLKRRIHNRAAAAQVRAEPVDILDDQFVVQRLDGQENSEQNGSASELPDDARGLDDSVTDSTGKDGDAAPAEEVQPIDCADPEQDPVTTDVPRQEEDAPLSCADVLDRPDVADLLGSGLRLHHSEASKQAGRRKPRSRRRPRAKAPPQIRTTLTRKWTHNEQLMVCCCGVIKARATFFESKGPAEALRFILTTFPSHLPRSRPSFLFYDNNCNLLRHMRAQRVEDLTRVGMAVDVFHASTKHSNSDAFCAEHCNPALFPELYLHEQKKWRFNSSAAEQINSWFGKFMAVVREMSEVHYNFFLDEMISVYNEYRVQVLEARGRRPRLVPLEELKLPI